MADDANTQTGEPGDAGSNDAGNAGNAGDGQTIEFQPITSQTQFDSMIQERIRRERAKFSDYGDLKEKAAKLDEIEAASKSELEKSQERIAQLEAEAQASAQAARESALRSAVISEAAKRDVVDPDAAVALLDRESLEFDDSGRPTNVADAMDALLEARPYLVKQNGSQRGTADQGARTSTSEQLDEGALATMSASEINQARREGRFADLGGGRKR